MEEIIYKEVSYVDCGVTYFTDISSFNKEHITCDCFKIYKDGNSFDCNQLAYAYIVYKNYNLPEFKESFVALCVQHFYFINSIDGSNLINELIKPIEIVYYENVDKYIERYLRLKDIL